MKRIILNSENLLEREQAHLYLAQMLDFPEYYGKNLDALFDCLTEQGECNIVLQGEAVLRQTDGYGAKILKVFQEAARANPGLRLEMQQSDSFQPKTYELDDRDRKLIEIGLEVLKENFDDGIYNHTVGCALLCKNGNIYKGVNCDGIHGSCAEYITMGIAISAGEREFDTIVAVHDKHLNCVIPPCGNCRQMLFEYCPDIKVIVNDDRGKLIKVKARDLLPFAWRPVVC